METLELKHLAPYLPYSLEFNCDFNGIQLMTGLFVTEEDREPLVEFKGYCACINDTTHKPILRPLSDLTKEIEIDGEKITPYDKLNYKPTIKHVSDYPFSYNDLQFISHYSFQLLIEWHFDIFGLIEKGFAIDINTLNK